MNDIDGEAEEFWTQEDAARELDPPLSRHEVGVMLALFGVPSVGLVKVTRGPGRKAKVYRRDDVLSAHAALNDLRRRLEKN